MKSDVIAVFGERFANTDLVARSRFSHVQAARFVYFSKVDEVFEAVSSGKAFWGIVPFQNSIAGPIEATDKSLRQHPEITIVARVSQRIEHHLLGVHGATLNDITHVSSQESCLAQVKKWLDAHLPRAKWKIVDSTAFAARIVAKRRDKSHAAIASRAAAKAYKLDIFVENIEPHGAGVPENVTEFVMIQKQAS